MIGDDWYEAESAPWGDVGRNVGRSYFEHYAEHARSQIKFTGVAGVKMEPGNGTAYRLVVARVESKSGVEMMAEIGCRNPISVVWADTPHGHVFQGGDLGILHENYVAEKMGVGLTDAWVIGRFLTALRSGGPL